MIGMNPEQAIRSNLKKRQDIQEQIKESVVSINADILRVIDRLKVKSVKQFQAVLPLILREVAKRQKKAHTPDIIRIARESVKMTKEVT